MPTLIHLSYFPNVAQVAAILQGNGLVIEAQDTYLKQTYRNRTCIYGTNGKLQLNIPVIHSQNNRQLYKDVLMKFEEPWQKTHLKSLESAYRKSPFFEYYIDDISVLFELREHNLFNFNLACLQVIFECLQLPLNYNLTETFEHQHLGLDDFRSLVYCKKEVAQEFPTYIQVFDEKHGFLENLSILDLLFNEGPAAVNYLETLNINK